MTYFTDTHCHLDFDRFDKDRAEVLKRAWDAGLVWILNPGIDIETSKAAIDLSKSNPEKINAAVGIHPNYGKAWSADLLEELRELSQEPEVVAIGEIGLDYYREHTPHDQQWKMFEAQLSLAEERGLPIVIHNRESTKDLLEILRTWVEGLRQSNNPLASHPGVLHSFSADLETAINALELNFFIGISGPVTFTNAPDRKAITGEIPLENLLLETDAPFLAPHPHRGKRNEPAFIPLIAEEIARLHNTSLLNVAERTFRNAMGLFKPERLP
ncbi:MAG: Putative DNase [Anaerolinea thermophila]|uniref:Putative DNase n=1 Tax=Anaerolinea thermophila TaxID=167964 RepID=A0A101FW96_9CHLR|nr:MAG: Putative DNase [Anaerolinea thermophila]